MTTHAVPPTTSQYAGRHHRNRPAADRAKAEPTDGRTVHPSGTTHRYRLRVTVRRITAPRTMRRPARPRTDTVGPTTAATAIGPTVPGPIRTTHRRSLRRSTRRTIGCVLLGIVGVLCMVIAVVGPPRKSDAQDAATTITGSVPPTTGPGSPTTTPTTPPGSVTSIPTATSAAPIRWTLLAGGDSLLTRQNADDEDPFAGIDPPLAVADLALVNVETAITTRGNAAVKQYTFRSPPLFAAKLAKAGVDIGSLANNHSLDFGYDALADSITALQQAGVTPIGAGANLTVALAPAERSIGPTRVAVFAASQIIPNGAWPATLTKPGIASAGKHRIDQYTQQLLAAVRTARQTHDLVIVFMHWGIEGSPCPSGVQIELSGLLHDAGARIVIGAHPHVLQPIVRTEDAGITAYSLGNFIWDPRGGATADTGVLQIDLVGNSLESVQFHPHRLVRGWANAAIDNRDGARIGGRVAKACPNARGAADVVPE